MKRKTNKASHQALSGNPNKILVLVITSLSFLNLFGQSAGVDTFTITAADKKLQPFERKYIQYIEYKTGFIEFNALLTRRLERALVKGKECWLVTQTYQLPKYIDRDSSYCELAGLKPIYYFTDITSESHREKVLFGEKEINNTILYKDSVVTSVKPAKNLYNGVTQEEIIACMPLTEGASFLVKTVIGGERFSELNITAFVEAKEEIEIPGLGKILCWRIRTGLGYGTSLEWYTVNGRVQVKKKYELGNGDVFYRVLIAS